MGSTKRSPLHQWSVSGGALIAAEMNFYQSHHFARIKYEAQWNTAMRNNPNEQINFYYEHYYVSLRPLV
jgi:hypothetical protein